MRIRTIHVNELGPLGSRTFDFSDTWKSETATNILFNGPNGCGKSTLLRAIAVLWNAFGYWLHNRKPLPRSNSDREWLQRWGGIAIRLEDGPFDAPPLILFFGESAFFESLSNSLQSCEFVGESVVHTGKPGAPARKFLWPKNASWLDEWTKARQKMAVSIEKSESPNVIFLDAEERRWLPPRRGIGEMKPENPQMRWLATYKVTDQWEGQLEASLLSLKTSALHRFHEMIRDMNAFLSGKEILTEVKLGENRLRVKLRDGSGTIHGIDELSAGEHQVLIQLYLIGRWLEKGGIVLIDEPDLYLHPSLVPGFLSRLEQMVAGRRGQLFITSHMPEIWSRYEALGIRILLETKR